ncbi:GntR family transcriptional regulator [Halobacillus andaensis]|uniref:GntR family transcriptional regulator n=1 Tax=Halobacillus andaensis TaxID=1176239 RepID=UPI003D7339E8
MSNNNEFDFLVNKTKEVKSLRDIVVDTIREAIVEGDLQPGERLKERELSERMGISTTPIKEAFRVLGHEGFIETIPRKGTFVSTMVDVNIEEVQMLRASVEGLCARLAAVKISKDELSQLKGQIEHMESLLADGSIEQLVEENTQFHQIIREIADSPMISKVSMNIENFDKAFRKRALNASEEVTQGFTEHTEIFKAIQKKDPDLAEKLMKNHIMRTVTNVLKKESINNQA